MNEKDERFLARWSRRKLEANERDAAKERTAAPEAAPHSGGAVPGHETGGRGGCDQQPTEPLTEADFADVDFEALTMESDYSRFLAPNVPDSVKYKALRRLWCSDPCFAQIDPFQDYADDFTDAACAVPAGALKTAYRVGRGFLTNEEVADWERLGAPPADSVARASEPAGTSEVSAPEPTCTGGQRQGEAADDPEQARAGQPAPVAEDATAAVVVRTADADRPNAAAPPEAPAPEPAR
jgi:hypothetical protein